MASKNWKLQLAEPVWNYNSDLGQSTNLCFSYFLYFLPTFSWRLRLYKAQETIKITDNFTYSLFIKYFTWNKFPLVFFSDLNYHEQVRKEIRRSETSFRDSRNKMWKPQMTSRTHQILVWGFWFWFFSPPSFRETLSLKYISRKWLKVRFRPTFKFIPDTNADFTMKSLFLGGRAGSTANHQLYKPLNLHTISPHTSQFMHANKANAFVLSVI